MSQIVPGRRHDMMGLDVGRVLPWRGRRTVGPFVFFDHMGPANLTAETPIAVLPHPHIGLATVTYLFDGAMMHRDSLGTEQRIVPGDVNWMTAGRGIVHSERSPEDVAGGPHHLHGIQAWVALPMDREECEPRFEHRAMAELPAFEAEGCSLRLIAGEAFGHEAPVRVDSRLHYLDCEAPAGATIPLADHAERAIYVVSGVIEHDGQEVAAESMLVLDEDERTPPRIAEAGRFMLLGGDALDARRTIWWNFVSSSKERIEQAKADWTAGSFPPVPGEKDRVPLPE